MRKKFQEGGLAEANSMDPSSALMSLFGQFNTTTPEAQRYARDILDEYGAYDWTAEEDIMERFRETAEESRAALKAAREDILAQEFDKRQLWLAAAQGFGAPTRTGQFGETIGNVAGLLREPMAEQREFERDKTNRLLELDQAMSAADQNLLMNEFAMQKLQRQTEGQMAREALKILGRPPRAGGAGAPPRPMDAPGIKSLDQKMATEYADWVTGGGAATKGKIALLDNMVGQLKSRDDLSGPWIGIIPKQVRDVVLPESANAQEVVETVAQESLKQILGGQFGQREGEMLLQRTFNPALEEWQNARRAEALMLKIQKAYDEKQRAMNYFADNGTMYGYDGKIEWTLEEFMPEETMRKVRMPNGDIIDVPSNLTTKKQVQQYYDRLREQRGYKRGGRVRSSFRHRRKFQEGGLVENFEELGEDYDEEFEDVGGFTPMDALRIVGGASAGLLGGVGAEEAGTRLYEMNQQLTRPPRSEQLIGMAMDEGNVAPTEMVTEVKRGQRMGVPEVPLDVSGRTARELGERAIMASGPIGDEALDMLVERQAESRQRVRRQVEKGLRTPEFYSTEDRLTEKLYTQAKPLYETAFKATIPAPPWWGEMYDSKYGRKAIQLALSMMKESGASIGKANVAGMVERPTLEFLDWVKKGYDQQIFRAQGNNWHPTAATPESRIIKQQKKRLVNYLDNNGPEEYKKARAQYKGDAEVLEALNMGRDSYYRMPVEEARRTLDAMSFAEKQALRTGFAQKMYEVIYAPTTDIAAARRLIGSPEMRGRLELLFDKPREYRVFEAALKREMDMWERNRGMIRRAEAGRTKRQIANVLEMDDPLAAVKQQIGRGPTMWVLRMLPPYGSKKSLTEKEADEIVRILTQGDVAELERIRPRLDYATEYAKKRGKRRGKAAMAGAALGAAIAAMSGDDEDEEDIDPEEMIEALQ
ncbi:hypothetical protein [[Eubacterium] cellulosolvens]